MATEPDPLCIDQVSWELGAAGEVYEIRARNTGLLPTLRQELVSAVKEYRWQLTRLITMYDEYIEKPTPAMSQFGPLVRETQPKLDLMRGLQCLVGLHEAFKCPTSLFHLSGLAVKAWIYGGKNHEYLRLSGSMPYTNAKEWWKRAFELRQPLRVLPHSVEPVVTKDMFEQRNIWPHAWELYRDWLEREKVEA